MTSFNFCFIFKLLFVLVMKTTWIQGLELYDSSTQICCLGKVHQAPDATEEDSDCCGDTLYDAKQYICCYNEVLPRPLTGSAYCCGNQVYTDDTPGICCDDVLVDMQADLRFNSSSLQETTNERIATSCCGQDIYNTQTEMCCKSGVVPRPYPSAECCEDVVYDGLVEICCLGKIHKTNGKNFFCCDTEAYDAITSLCCNGEIHSKPDNRLITDEEGSKSSGVVTCCGTEMMDVENDICCEDQVITISNNNASECCGTSSYDPATQLCCNGVPQTFTTYDTDASISETEVPGYKTACCSSQIYYIDKEVCCNGVVHQLDLIPKNKPIICCGSDLLINTDWDMCCGERTVTKRTQNTQCCGSNTYETDRQICCNGGLVRTKGSATELCCGDIVFDYSKQICCFEDGFRVLAMDEKTSSCCAKPSTMSKT